MAEAAEVLDLMNDQFLMQHLQLPPNLDPSPATDRPALAKALAKKPEDRFPSVSALIRALRQGSDPSLTTAVRPSVSASTPPALVVESFVDLSVAAGGSPGVSVAGPRPDPLPAPAGDTP